jgi:hypothetical protein
VRVCERKFIRRESGEDVAIVIHSIQFIKTLTLASAFVAPGGSDGGLLEVQASAREGRRTCPNDGTRKVLEFQCLSSMMFNRTKHWPTHYRAVYVQCIGSCPTFHVAFSIDFVCRCRQELY